MFPQTVAAGSAEPARFIVVEHAPAGTADQAPYVLVGKAVTFDAGASNVGISNLVTFLANTAPYRRILRSSEYGDLDKDREALVKLSPSSYVDRVTGPLLIMSMAEMDLLKAEGLIRLGRASEAVPLIKAEAPAPTPNSRAPRHAASTMR